MKTLRALTLAALATGAAAFATATAPATPLTAQEPSELNDLEMAHVAVTASNIDIRYAHLALALSDDPAIRQFAETMIRDHTAVNEQVVALAQKLDVQARDNPMSRQLLAQAAAIRDELSRLRGEAFDAHYAENELAYHETVNGVVEGAFIPNIENDEVKAVFRQALAIFRGHERHARVMVRKVTASRGEMER